MSPARVGLASLSAAMDGGFTAIADVSEAMSVAGAEGDYRLIGGVTVMLHIQRLGLDLPLRATGHADFGLPPHVLRRPDLVQAIERLGEETKFGFDEEEVVEALQSEEFKKMSNIKIVGLMGMATNTTDESQIRKEFKSLRNLFTKLKTHHP